MGCLKMITEIKIKILDSHDYLRKVLKFPLMFNLIKLYGNCEVLWVSLKTRFGKYRGMRDLKPIITDEGFF